MSEIEKFEALKGRLPAIWSALSEDPGFEHTSLIVPSLTVNQEELSKITGAAFYEERLLFALIRLRNPNARLIYVTSQPVNPDIIDYYLDLLDGVPARHARERLRVLSVLDDSPRSLTEKVLERPRFLQRLRGMIDKPENAYLTCYNSTPLERQLAIELDLPLNGLDPELLTYGTKSGNRKVFGEAGISYPAGTEDLHTEDEIIDALLDLAAQRPQARQAVVKLNEGFGGEGNAVYTFPGERGNRDAIQGALSDLEWTSGTETSESFLRKFSAMGGIVEEMLIAEEIRSPSVQMRISPDGVPELVSSHEQVLGGATGQSYLGCQFPSEAEYRVQLLREAEKVGEVLAAKGVIGRFAIDFLVGRNSGGPWEANAIEINLRMGGTTPPFHAMEFLTGGRLDPESGLFLSPQGQPKFYSATDNLKSPAYRGLLPEDLFEIIARRGLGYSHATGTGSLFHMIGALSQYGKVGLTCIGNSPDEAQELFEHAASVLDEATESGSHGVQTPLLDRHLAME